MRCGARAQKPKCINDKETIFKVRRRWLLQHNCHKVPVLHVLKYHYMEVGGHGKLVDNFSPESDVTSLQDPFTSRPYKTPF